MSSRAILLMHTAMFLGLLIAAPVTSLAVIYYPQWFPGRYLVALCMTGIAISVYLWRKHDGCPCTIKEKEALRREGKEVFDEACLTHYARKWLGISLPGWSATALPLALMGTPLLIGASRF